ncbi:glycosyltransferase [Nocardioides humilatus]|uniref:glycosyltransferase n=1 Tax=Nocardioides humilatus TaxID=2607660 RepID=UPI00165F9920|nr:glycosyltransferase [Nocardioides humilatus]
MSTTVDPRRYGSYLLAVGGIAPELGSIELLEAYAAMLQERRALAGVRLVVAGWRADVPTDYGAEFVERAWELGVSPVVLGDVSDADLSRLIAAAAGFVHLPSSADHCAAALEALASGVPVVARDLPGLRAVLADVVAYGDTVLSIADAMVDVLTVPPEPASGIALAAARASAHGA